MVKTIFIYVSLGFLGIFLLAACSHLRSPPAPLSSTASAAPEVNQQPYMAQVVGLQWLNPLQRKDYSTQWQLLWTLGVAQPNPDDDMVREKPEKYTRLQSIASIAVGNNGSETFLGYHHKYIEDMFDRFHGVYYSDPGACKNFCVKRGHEIIPKRMFHDRHDDHQETPQKERALSIPS